MYNYFFSDEIFENDKDRAIRIIKRINHKIDALNDSKLKKEEKEEKILCRELIIKVLRYTYTL